MKNLLFFLNLFSFCWTVQAFEIKVQDLFNYSKNNLEPLGDIIEKLSFYSTEIVDLKVILWYFGPNGLKVEGVQFYNANLFQKIKTLESQFFLYDLTAWSDFKNLNQKGRLFEKESSIAKNIVGEKRYQVLFSSGFFKWVRDFEQPSWNYLVKEVFPRKTLRQKSLENQIVNDLSLEKTLKELNVLKKSEGSDEFAEFLSLKAPLTYSVFQYLEGIYLVKRILEKTSEKKVKILFLLPNDEVEYYRFNDREIEEKKFVPTFYDRFSIPRVPYSDFEDDLDQLIPPSLKDRFYEITVYFQAFQYQNSLKDRPYLNGNQVIRSKSIKSMDDLINWKM